MLERPGESAPYTRIATQVSLRKITDDMTWAFQALDNCARGDAPRNVFWVIRAWSVSDGQYELRLNAAENVHDTGKRRRAIEQKKHDRDSVRGHHPFALQPCGDPLWRSPVA
jgi:hypothetical protein